MPRDARIGTDIWAENSIRNLTRDAQRAYLLLLTQPDLSRCGALPYRPRYWSRLSADDSDRKLRRAIQELTTNRHVLVDEDTDELLVRTYIAHDGLLRQPNVVAAMVKDYEIIGSPTIRLTVLSELRRIWHRDTTDLRERAGWLLANGVIPTDMEPRTAARLRTSIGTGLRPHFTDAIAKGHLDPFTEPLPEPLAKPFGNAPTRATRVAPTPPPPPPPGGSVEPPRRGDHDRSRSNKPAAGSGGHSGLEPSAVAELVDRALAESSGVKAWTPTRAAELRPHLVAGVEAGADLEVLVDALRELRRRGAMPGLLPKLVDDRLNADSGAGSGDPHAEWAGG